MAGGGVAADQGSASAAANFGVDTASTAGADEMEYIVYVCQAGTVKMVAIKFVAIYQINGVDINQVIVTTNGAKSNANGCLNGVTYTDAQISDLFAHTASSTTSVATGHGVAG